MRSGLLLCCWLSLLAFSAQANDRVYKTQDEQGRTIYSDRPAKDDQEEVKLPALNTLPPQETSDRRQVQSRQQIEDAIRYEVQITNPAPDSSVPPGQRDLSISVTVEPGLRSDHFLAYYMNDQLIEESRRSQLVVEEISRGSHTLIVDVVDEDGRVLGSSEPVVVNVHRPSLLNPNRR